MVTPTDEILAGSGPLSHQPFGLAVFDLDGTLLRGPTVCEVLAWALGRLDHMRRLEALIAGLSDIDIAAAREEMVRWYQGIPLADLTSQLRSVTLAPRASEGITFLLSPAPRCRRGYCLDHMGVRGRVVRAAAPSRLFRWHSS
jgi:hypothetical protein